jgi:N,N'-diacetyllegionaminate synthase
MREMDILVEETVVGPGSKVFVMAEIGINHNGNVNQAIKMIDEAAESGADAVKFQSFRVDKLLIPSQNRYAQQMGSMESAYQMLRRCELSWEDQEKLKKHAEEKKVLFLSTPFDEETVDFLDSLGVPAFKIASSDITHIPLLRHIAKKGKPIFMSTGMSFLSEVGDALQVLRSSGAKEILLMHCVSAYPTPPQNMNLRALETLQSHFELPVGLSDHSEGILLPLIAVALGSVVIEKHFTLDKNASGADHKCSMDPEDLRQLVKTLRDVEASLGDGRKRPSDIEEEGRLLGRRSIVAAVDIRAHETIAPWMLTCKRPGSGLEPRYKEQIIGMAARRNISKNTILQWEDLAPIVSRESVSGNNLMERDVAALRQHPMKKRHA